MTADNDETVVVLDDSDIGFAVDGAVCIGTGDR
jgi:hypothetical protein